MKSFNRSVVFLLACWLLLACGMAQAQFNPAAPPASVAAYYEADKITSTDGTQVTAWSDASLAGGHNLSGSSSTITWRNGTNGIGGHPAVQFGGSTNGLRSATWTTALTQTDTVFIVFKNAATSATNFMFDDVSQAGETTRQAISSGTSGKLMSVYAGALLQSAGAADTTAHYAEVQFAGASTYAKVDGITQFTGFDSGSNTLNSLALGNNVAGVSWTGEIACVIVCDSTATLTNLSDIRTYIVNKYFATGGTDFTLSPASGSQSIGTPTTYTLTVNGTLTSTETFALSAANTGTGTGTFSATTVTILAGATSNTFTYTPASGSTGTHTITAIGSGQFAATHTATLTVTAGPITVQFDQSNLAGAASIYCTEGNWYYDSVGKSITATHFGSYFKLAFNVPSTSPTFQVNFPASGFTLGASGSGGYIGYSIDGGTSGFAAVTNSSTTITATNTAAGVHTLWIWVAQVNLGGNRFNLGATADAIQITSIQAPAGSNLINISASGGVTDVNGHFLPLYAKRTWVDGDSTAEAYNSQLGATPPTNGILSWAISCGAALQSETSILATSSSNFTAGNAGIPASLSASGGTFSLTTPSSLTYYFTGLSRLNGSNLYPNPPDYYICNQGRNQWTQNTLTVGGQQTAYGLPSGYTIGTPNAAFLGYLTNYATAVRALCGSTTKIFMVCPYQKIFTTSAETAQVQEWAQEFAAWTPIDANTFSVNNGVTYADRSSGASANLESVDGIHLTPFQHQMEAPATTRVLQLKLSGAPSAPLGGASLVVTVTNPTSSATSRLISWTADSLATSYKVLRSTDGINYVKIATVAPPTVTYTDAARPSTGNVYYSVLSVH